MMAGLIIEIFNKSTLSNEHCAELFQLLEVSLHKLGQSEQHVLTVESFKLNLLRQIGVLPDLESCVSCHERWESTHGIWLEPNGRLRCQKCLYPRTTGTSENHPAGPADAHNTKAKLIQFSIIKLIHYLIKPLSEQTKNITFNPEQKEQLQHITRFFLQHFLEREILSEKMMATLEMKL